MHGRQRQAQQHLIFDQGQQVELVAGKNGIAGGQRIQSLEFVLVACQMHRPLDPDRMLQTLKTALAGQFHLAVDEQLQRHPAERISAPADSTEQLTLRKFTNQTRKRRHVRTGFPGLRVTAETPRFDLDRLKHGAPYNDVPAQPTDPLTHPVKL